jgi:hypothetical protein
MENLWYQLVLEQWSPTFLWQRVTPVIRAGSRAALAKLTITGSPNCLNYCEIFVVYTQFTNVAECRIIQPGGPRVGNLRYIAQWVLDPISVSSLIRVQSGKKNTGLSYKQSGLQPIEELEEAGENQVRSFFVLNNLYRCVTMTIIFFYHKNLVLYVWGGGSVDSNWSLQGVRRTEYSR